MEKSEELIRAIENANNGMWFPISVIIGVFGILVMLLLYIWKQSQRTNDKRHNDNEAMITELKDSHITVGKILVELQSNQKHQQKEIDHLTN